jgi:hypothetical protein
MRRFRCVCPRNFDGLFLRLLCTIRPLSEESWAPPSRGANAFWGLLPVRRNSRDSERPFLQSARFGLGEPTCICLWHMPTAIRCTGNACPQRWASYPVDRLAAFGHCNPRTRFLTE